jgi:hypothetical protein
MSRINLVIADHDSEYVESLVAFILSKHSARFRVSSFTNARQLADYVLNNEQRADIFLVNSSIYNEAVKVYNKAVNLNSIKSIIILTDNMSTGELHGCKSIYKYQHGDAIINSIIKILSEDSENRSFNIKGNKKTILAAVYSPAGGTGKTSIALGCSILCSRENLSVFYLNLEDMPPIGFFPSNDSNANLSNVVFHIKYRTKNFDLRIEGCRSTHQDYGIHYFAPPDSVSELDELKDEDALFLVDRLQAIGQYDVVFIDMCSSFSKRNRTLLEVCDYVFFVHIAGKVPACKARAFSREISIMMQEEDTAIPDKLIPVLNKYRYGDNYDFEGIDLFSNRPFYNIPYIEELDVLDSMDMAVNPDNEFAIQLGRVLKASGII